MSALTDFANGKPCLIRTPGYCSFRDEQTVAAHVPLADFHGTALKMPDLFITFGCAVCHDFVDARKRLYITEDDPEQMSRDALIEEVKRLRPMYMRNLQLEGMIRTQHYVMRKAPELLLRLA